MDGRSYANLLKVRLGTWGLEEEAARAHDVGAIAFCRSGATLNARPRTRSCCAFRRLLLF